MSVARTLIKLREFQVNSAETLAYGNEASTTTNVKNALDWIFSVLYPNTKESVDTTADLPLIGNSLNDYRVVLDDGDGKASGYRWEQREGEVAPTWHKIHDMDWSSSSILSSLFDQTQEVFVYRRGRMDLDASGNAITGLFEGQTITGGTTGGNLTFNANANALTSLPSDQTGFVQFFGNTRPTHDDIFDLGTATERFHSIFLAGNLSDGSVALTLANLKAAYDHISIASGNPHSVAYAELISRLGTLTIDGDASGSVDLSTGGNKTLTLTVANDSHTHDAASTIINFDAEVYGYLKSALVDNANITWSFNDLTEEVEASVTIDTTTITNIDDPLANKILVGSPDGLSWVKSSGTIEVTGDVTGSAQYNSLLDKWGIATTIGHTPMSSVDGFILTNKTFTSVPGPATVVTAIAHGLQTGEKVSIFGASLSGVFTITYLTTDTFSVPSATLASDTGYYIPQGGQLLWNPTIGKFQVAKEYEEIRLAELSGLSEDVLTQYVAKDGRSLGQTIKGGISASEKLTLESTSNAVKGTIEFKDNITPATDAVYSGGWTGKDVGSPSKRVNDLYMAGEAKGLRVENVGSLPASSGTTVGKLVAFNNKLYMDNGATYEIVGPSSGGGGASGGAFVGNVTDNFSGNGSTTDFTLSVTATNKQYTNVYIGGVYQFKSTYSVSGTLISFSSPPPVGTNNIEVEILQIISNPAVLTPVIEVFNSDIINGSGALSATGAAYYTAPIDIQLYGVWLEIFDKGTVASGILSIDIKKNTSANPVGMASVLSLQPQLNMAVDAEYSRASGTVSSSLASQGDVLRLDLTSIPAGLGKFRVLVYAKQTGSI